MTSAMLMLAQQGTGATSGAGPENTSPASGAAFDTGENPVGMFNGALREQLDILNHPDSLSTLLLQMNTVWAVIFIIVGIMCVLHGYRWHKALIVVLAGMSGVWLGYLLGEHVGSVVIAAVCSSVLLAILAWPMMRYAVALFGGLAGAFAGANIWTATGHDPGGHATGALIGLLVVGMLAFLTFRFVVITLTTIGGASLLVFGAMAGLLQIESWRGGILDSMEGNPLIVPVVVGSAAVIGAVWQFGGGARGMAAMANKADTSKKKDK